MSVNWNVGKIEGFNDWGWYKAPCDDPMGGHKAGDELLNGITNQLIWATLVIGLGRWTAKNINEVFYRIRSYELLCGPLCRIPTNVEGAIALGTIRKDTFDGLLLSKAEILRHVGLSVNVTDTSNAFWNKHLGEIARKEILR